MVEQTPEEHRHVVMNLLDALASTEFASVEHHRPWINQGPTPEDRSIRVQITADEAHQGFIDRRMLRTFGADGAALAEDLLKDIDAQIEAQGFGVPPADRGRKIF